MKSKRLLSILLTIIISNYCVGQGLLYKKENVIFYCDFKLKCEFGIGVNRSIDKFSVAKNVLVVSEKDLLSKRGTNSMQLTNMLKFYEIGHDQELVLNKVLNFDAIYDFVISPDNKSLVVKYSKFSDIWLKNSLAIIDLKTYSQQILDTKELDIISIQGWANNSESIFLGSDGSVFIYCLNDNGLKKYISGSEDTHRYKYLPNNYGGSLILNDENGGTINIVVDGQKKPFYESSFGVKALSNSKDGQYITVLKLHRLLKICLRLRLNYC